MYHSKLTHHLTTACPSVTCIDVRVAPQDDGGLCLTYTLTGSTAQLAIPAPVESVRQDGLWKHTCFEAFVMVGQGPGYREFNFSPSGAWAAYTFKDYRTEPANEPMPAPAIDCRLCEMALVLEARLPAIALPHLRGLRLALSAVVEDHTGHLSYWALRHPPGKPDFHHTCAFALELDLP